MREKIENYEEKRRALADLFMQSARPEGPDQKDMSFSHDRWAYYARRQRDNSYAITERGKKKILEVAEVSLFENQEGRRAEILADLCAELAIDDLNPPKGQTFEF